MQTVLQDLRYALTSLKQRPGFTAVAIVTLALGIAANTAVFSVVRSILLRPLPYPSPQELTLLWTNFGLDLPQNWLSGPELLEMRELATQFQDIAVVVPITANLTAQGPGDEPQEINVGLVSGNFFRLLGIEAQVGRLVEPADDVATAQRIAVVGHGLWQRRYGGDEGIVGETLTADGLVYTIAGILPQDFAIVHPDAQFPGEVDLWTATTPAIRSFFGVDSYAQLPRGNHGFRGFGRMKPGVSLIQAQSDMDAVAEAIRRKSPDYYDFEGWGITVLSLHDDLVEDVKPALLILLGAVGFVLLIAVVNVANLMLTRAAGREREMALRRALGASRWRLLQQLGTESLALAMVGGVAGLGLAFLLVRVLSWWVPVNLPRGGEIAMDLHVLLFTVVLSLLTGVLFGLAPVVYTLRQDLSPSFKTAGSGTTTGVVGRRLRLGLVIAEVAFALLLLVGAGLLMRSFLRLLESDPGFESENRLTLRIALSPSRPPQDTVAFFDQLLDRVRGLPGVTSAGTISHLPLSGSYSSGTTRVRESSSVAEDDRAIEADRRQVSTDYFTTMGVSLLKGRSFREADNSQASLVAMVDEEFVRRFWPNEDPVGQSVAISSDDDGPEWREVVGVVAHSRHYNLSTVGREQVYVPYRQRPTASQYLTLRTSGDPLALAAAVRSEVWALDPDQPVSDVASMTDRVAGAVSQPRFNLFLLGAFASLALLLAAIGIYGVISYSVSQRSHEIGVRMALGAAGGDVLSLVVKQVSTLVAVGLAVGTLLAAWLMPLLESLLYTVDPDDPLTFTIVIAILLLAASMAAWTPARRATRVAPVDVLKTE